MVLLGVGFRVPRLVGFRVLGLGFVRFEGLLGLVA